MQVKRITRCFKHESILEFAYITAFSVIINQLNALGAKNYFLIVF